METIELLDRLAKASMTEARLRGQVETLRAFRNGVYKLAGFQIPNECDHCARALDPGVEAIETCDHEQKLVLCRDCYNKAGNAVR